MLHQTFDPTDLGTIGLLFLLEGILSVDNALVLSVMAARLPREMAGKALAYGLIAAVVFRLVAVVVVSFLLEWGPIRPIAAIYLAYLAIRRLFFKPKVVAKLSQDAASFWRAVFAIEVTDLAFAVDNVLAAVALVGAAPAGAIHPKLWVIFTGGMMGVILTRFAAAACLNLVRRFPRLETSAYGIMLLVACKLGLEWQNVDFSSGHAPFWVFWALLAAILGYGFVPGRSAPLP
jgi:YkoY family integral membrane protein